MYQVVIKDGDEPKITALVDHKGLFFLYHHLANAGYPLRVFRLDGGNPIECFPSDFGWGGHENWPSRHIAAAARVVATGGQR